MTSRGRLVLMRHAKSAYPTGVADHDRPLNERGERDVVAAQQWFAEHGAAVLGSSPSVLVSTATRTQQTWQGIKPALPDASAEQAPRVYEAAVSTLIDLCAPRIAAGQSTLVIGHNPGIEALANFLADPSLSVPKWAQREKYPTAAIAVLEFIDDTWALDCAVMRDFVVPRG